MSVASAIATTVRSVPTSLSGPRTTSPPTGTRQRIGPVAYSNAWARFVDAWRPCLYSVGGPSTVIVWPTSIRRPSSYPRHLDEGRKCQASIFVLNRSAILLLLSR